MESIDTILRLRPSGLRLTAHPFEFTAIEVEGTLTCLVLCLVTLLTLGEVIVVITSVAVGLPSVEL